MYSLVVSKPYRKSYARISRSGKFPEEEIDFVVEILLSGEKLEASYRDHGLSGDMSDFRECHIRPDLLLIYEIKEDVGVLSLINIGSHSELFG